MATDLDDTGGSWQIGGAEDGWWAEERATFLAERLAPAVAGSRLAVDLGCGRGEAVEFLADLGAPYVVGLDAEIFPSWARRPGRTAYVIADLNHLPLRPGVADLVTTLDVIEHFEDDQTPLRAARVVAGDGATVAVTVPAHPGLWSPYDVRVGHHRRYTKATLDASVRRAGLVPDRSTTYFFSWLAPPAWVLRKRDRADADSDVGGFVRTAVGALCRVERAVLRRRSLPLGTSLWVRCSPRR